MNYTKETPTMTNEEIEKSFDAAKKIALVLNHRSKESQRRILMYFQSLVTEKTDMGEEFEILKQVSHTLGIPLE